MANRLLRVRQVSTSTSTPDAGDGRAQFVPYTITGMTDGAGLCIDLSENIYICDADNHVIFRFRRGDSSSKIFAGTYGVSGSDDGQAGDAKFNKPTAIACDKRGFLYVVDTGNSLIRRIDDNANVFTVAAIPAEAAGDEPGGIVVDAGGDIFIIDNTPV